MALSLPMPLKVASVVERLSRSQIFKDYERAFGELTGLPLSLRTEEVLQLVQRGKKYENPFCALLVKSSHSCAECLRVQDAIGKREGLPAHTITCFAGLCDTAVPIRVGNLKIGLLQTGQVLLKKPSRSGFRKAARQLMAWGAKVNLQKLEEAYFHSQVLSPDQYKAAVRLLEIFAQHLTVAANDLVLKEKAGEPDSVHKARAYINQHQGDKMSLREVAKAVNTSTSHFCRTFKKVTGLNFTEYLSRVRIGKAKNLLMNPNLRVTEIAYGVGFQSLPHFNKMFKRFAGVSPSAFRKRHS